MTKGGGGSGKGKSGKPGIGSSGKTMARGPSESAGARDAPAGARAFPESVERLLRGDALVQGGESHPQPHVAGARVPARYQDLLEELEGLGPAPRRYVSVEDAGVLLRRQDDAGHALVLGEPA